ncbi:hypothetical protein GCM10027036_27900 [Flavihumibacter cheonanensis]|uniref:DUF5007 domain-containing protein n=1 Tax=Flavihumibacter cheonanensis TaxID=1442385 RepID=UPI001EF92DA0|nr:DUF5007 domain-containing protein [Flavihumibacter cheonanensis]MCG7753187.1 DUF5007 domain-containing protein [Flavihumibacter cheonanensis]
MKKLTYLYMLLLLSGVLANTGCKKLDDGFLSPIIRYEEDPIIIQRGRVKVSSALNFDGSSRPVTVKLLHVYNRVTGALMDSVFSKQYEIKGWTGLYDPKSDTTLELIGAKQKDMQVNPIVVNPVSGQLEANFTTIYLPLGQYEFDLEISNAGGTKVYEKIGKFDLVDAKPYEAHPEIGTPYNRMIKVGDENTGSNLLNPEVTIKRTADAPNKVVVRFMDKNGVTFNPKANEIQRRPYPGNNPPQPFLQTMQDYSLATDLYDDRMEFSYGVVPFPLSSLGNGFNYYYRIPANLFTHDNQTSFPDGTYSANPRFVFRAFVPGTYEVEFKLIDLIKK